jgi:hypothetical protein
MGVCFIGFRTLYLFRRLTKYRERVNILLLKQTQFASSVPVSFRVELTANAVNTKSVSTAPPGTLDNHNNTLVTEIKLCVL